MQVADPQGQLVAVKLIRSLIPGPYKTHVGTRYPNGERTSVVVTRVGGVLSSPIHERVMLSISCYDSDEAQAERLAGFVRMQLHTGDWRGLRIDGHMIRGWREAAGPARLADPDRPKQVRFQFSGELTVSLLTNH